MGAVRTKTVADLRHRRLQAVVIGTVLFLASTAATLALSILVESNAPFEQAFASANGAHVVVDYDGRLSAAQLASTETAPGVTSAAGPWPVTDGAINHPKGGLIEGARFSGRPDPGSAIDRITVAAGRWWRAPGEVVLDRDTARLLNRGVGDTVSLHAAPSGKEQLDAGPPPPGSGAAPLGPGRQMTVVGIARSVSTPNVAAWMSAEDIAALTPVGAPAQQMLYRVSPSATAADVAAATTSITHGVPADSIVSSTSYLDLKAGVDRLADLYVPVLLAFAVFALLAAAFTIANVVTGIVLTGYRDIAVMKAVGFTPLQIVAILVGQMLLPVALGALGGVIVGTLGSQRIVEQTAASFGLPTGVSLSLPVIVAVLVTSLLAAVLAAIGPAVQAGRLSAVGALSRGTAPSASPDGGRLRRLGMRLPVRLPVRLGVAAGVAHPVRASMTLGALVVGVAALTFAVGLNWSLLRVFTDLNRNEAAPVRAEIRDSSIYPAHVTAAIATSPQTGKFVAVSQTDVTVPGLGEAPFVGYDGDASWIGYALIDGHWLSAAGEAVAPTNFFTRTGLHVGDSVALSGPGGSVTVRLVGEILDNAREGRDNLVLRGVWTDLVRLDPTAQPSRWEAQPVDGVDPQQYRSSLGDAIGRGVSIFVQGDSSNDDSFLLFLSVVATLGAVLVAISLGGVFNTVLLETRQRTREMAVLKAIGLTPAQGLEMVLWSVVPVGIVAGLAGLPIGIICQRLVLTYMGQVAAKTAIPTAVFDVFTPVVIAGLALAGLGIGLLGAVAPARRAARLKIAPVLQAE